MQYPEKQTRVYMYEKNRLRNPVIIEQQTDQLIKIIFTNDPYRMVVYQLSVADFGEDYSVELTYNNTDIITLANELAKKYYKQLNTH